MAHRSRRVAAGAAGDGRGRPWVAGRGWSMAGDGSVFGGSWSVS